MPNITYRPYQESDAERVKELLDEAFHIHLYTQGSASLTNSALEGYLRGLLTKSTFAEVAELDGEVVGVVMASIKGQPYLPDRARNRVKSWIYTAKFVLTGLARPKAIIEYYKFEAAYGKLHREAVTKKGDIGDELTVFAVHGATRGTGIGRHLYDDFKNRLMEAGHKDYFLYTDSLCSFGFYEKDGMDRTASHDIKITVPELPNDVGVYLYTGEVSN